MEETMKEMTDEEADALDEYYTKNPNRANRRNGTGADCRFCIGFLFYHEPHEPVRLVRVGSWY
jgi:hypothetical protein